MIKNKILSLIIKYCILFWIGGSTYVTIEVLYRSRSHISMFLLAGIIFILCGLLNEIWEWTTPLFLQVFIGTLIALFGEFITGCVVNLWLNLNIWDYSELPFNLLGQICPQFAIIWMPLIFIAKSLF